MSNTVCCYRCIWISNIILFSGIIALIVWSAVRGYRLPACSVEDFYVPCLNATNNSTSGRTNHTLYLVLRLQNRELLQVARYDEINVTFFYGETMIPVGNYTFPRFHQGYHKRALRKALVETDGVPWEAAYANVSNGSTVTFWVELATRVTYRSCYDSGCSYHTYDLVEEAKVSVDGSGQRVNKKGIRLKSAAAGHTRRPGGFLGLSVMLLNFLVLLV